MADTPTLYPHRQNKDRSHNPMSLAFFTTVARSESEAELAEKDKAHVCDSAFLAERCCFNRAESMRHPAPMFQRNPQTGQGQRMA
jgi:hypothetical protein